LLPPSDGKQGDLIEGVEVEEDGKKISWDDKSLDPVRLPVELRQWADRLEQKNVPGPWIVTLKVQRHRQGTGPQFEPKTLKLEWDNSWKYDRITLIDKDSPLAVAELGFAFRATTTVAGADAKIAKDLLPGDVVKSVRLTYVNAAGTETKGSWHELGEGQWGWFAAAYLQRFPSVKHVTLKVYRNKDEKDKEIEITPVADEQWPMPELGLIFQRDLRRLRADTLWGAIRLGFGDTVDNVIGVFQNIRSMVTGRVSVENLSGPILIARIAYLVALVDSWQFVFFLGMISINLAVINFLPIPVLDGGHMVFLIYEKIRGKPASEGVRIGATYAGLALILCLMVFVFYLDISRLFGKT
jgi:regulator of sigma E protease